MKATFKTLHAGNIALQEEVFQIPLDAAKMAVKYMKNNGEIGPGKYWNEKIAKPTRRAIIAKQEFVTVYVAGFSTGELANVLHCVGCDTEKA